ncbi:MAG: DNA-directed RNA polymerase subunit alpha [Planctomycetes bacterium]|nr:DNA-directed RNA polymerase subunit alpha [Planctomycetota bacterium]
MRIRWKGLELPSKVVVEDSTGEPVDYAKFVVEPFERGFGVTVGNSLRRVLLSGLEGSAVTGIKIDNVLHEFSSIEGVLEDITEIVLNVKNLIVKLEGDDARTVVLERGEKGEVKAGAIQTDPNVEIVNKDLVLCTLTADIDFRMELTVERGRGYVTAEENIRESQPIGYIPVDALYSPVKRVRYSIEETRVGQRTDYDKLILEVWTNGITSPEMALVEASRILRKHFNPFVYYGEPGEPMAIEPGAEEVETEKEYVSELEQKMALSVDTLDLSVRASNCLASEKITTIGQLVQKTDEDLLKVRSFGKTSLREVKRKLADIGLSLGMDLQGTMVTKKE